MTCDCCNRERELSRCWAFGIETFACDECRRIESEDYDDEGDEQQRYETKVRAVRPATEEELQKERDDYKAIFGEDMETF